MPVVWPAVAFIPVPAAATPVAACWVRLYVTAVATPLPSRVTVVGFFRPKLPQFRLVKDIDSRLPMNVARLLPTAATGVPKLSSFAMSRLFLADWMLTMFWQ